MKRARVCEAPAWHMVYHSEPQSRPGPYFAIGSHTNLEAKLQQKGIVVTHNISYWVVALGKGSSLIVSVRRQIGMWFAIRSPEVGLETYFAIGSHTNIEAKLHKEGIQVTNKIGHWVVDVGIGCLLVSVMDIHVFTV